MGDVLAAEIPQAMVHEDLVLRSFWGHCCSTLTSCPSFNCSGAAWLGHNLRTIISASTRCSNLLLPQHLDGNANIPLAFPHLHKIQRMVHELPSKDCCIAVHSLCHINAHQEDCLSANRHFAEGTGDCQTHSMMRLSGQLLQSWHIAYTRLTHFLDKDFRYAI